MTSNWVHTHLKSNPMDLSLLHSLSDLWVKVHLSIITIRKMEMAVFHHLFHLQVQVSTIEAVHWDLASIMSAMTLTHIEGYRGKNINTI